MADEGRDERQVPRREFRPLAYHRVAVNQVETRKTVRINSAHLRNYKRFTDLQITDIPETARLVVVIGPNGSGKSSLFDAFLFKAQNEPSVRNTHMDHANQEYYYKSAAEAEQRNNSQSLWRRIDIDFHSGEPASGKWQTTFYIRSPYRNEPEFQVASISAVGRASEKPRFNRIIDSDQAVSDSYRRLAWKRLTDLDSKAPADTTFGHYRSSSILELQAAMTDLFNDLQLQDFGGITGKGGFRFAKGTTPDFQYKNLSGGEKAAFDLLLDMFVKRDEYQDAIYCIDEPEAHVAVAIQGKLLDALLALLPPSSQLWIATHSVGFVRAASQRMESHGDAVFLDFKGQDFDKPVVLRPQPTSRSFWRSVYQVALDELAALVAPARIVLCEGNRDRPSDGFDAKCYSKLFADDHGDTMFLSRGSASQVENSDDLIAVIKEVVEGAEILKLIDRDDMTDERRDSLLADNSELRVLRRRELENYLYDAAVVRTFLAGHDIMELPESIEGLLVNPGTGDARYARQQILVQARKLLPGEQLGRDSREFELTHLVPALKATESVCRELETEIFR